MINPAGINSAGTVRTLALRKIISGGQTGADIGGLLAAEALALATGGMMPRDWRTEDGVKPEYAARFAMTESRSLAYRDRTYQNVIASDATLIFGRLDSTGSMLTQRYAVQLQRPWFHVAWPCASASLLGRAREFREWLAYHRVATLNVAGNRESKNPGISVITRDFLINILRGELNT